MGFHNNYNNYFTLSPSRSPLQVILSIIIIALFIVWSDYSFIGIIGSGDNSVIVRAVYTIQVERQPVLLLNRAGAEELCRVGNLTGRDYFKWIVKGRISEVSGYVAVLSREMRLDAVYTITESDVSIGTNLTVPLVKVYYVKAVIEREDTGGYRLNTSDSIVELVCTLRNYTFTNNYIYREGMVPYISTDKGLLFAGSGLLFTKPGVLGNTSFTFIAGSMPLLQYQNMYSQASDRWIYALIALVGSPPGRSYRNGNVSFTASETMGETGLQPPPLKDKKAFAEWRLRVYEPLLKRIAELIAEAAHGEYRERRVTLPTLGIEATDYIVKVDNATVPTEVRLRLGYSRPSNVKALYHAGIGILIELNITSIDYVNGIIESLIGQDFILRYGSQYTVYPSNVWFMEDLPEDEYEPATGWYSMPQEVTLSIRLVSISVIPQRAEIPGESAFGEPTTLALLAVGVLAVIVSLIYLALAGSRK